MTFSTEAENVPFEV